MKNNTAFWFQAKYWPCNLIHYDSKKHKHWVFLFKTKIRFQCLFFCMKILNFLLIYYAFPVQISGFCLATYKETSTYISRQILNPRECTGENAKNSWFSHQYGFSNIDVFCKYHMMCFTKKSIVVFCAW